MQPTKPFWQSKTVWANALTVLVAVLTLATQQLDLSAETLKWLLFLVGSLNIVLRFVTSQPVALTEEADWSKPLTDEHKE